MIDIKSVADCALITDGSHRSFIQSVVEWTINNRCGHPYIPEEDGFFRYLETMEDISELPPDSLWEAVNQSEDTGITEVFVLHNNQYVMSYYVPFYLACTGELQQRLTNFAKEVTRAD